ncbi:MAG: acyl-CoA synthetase [Chloroflexi bacterium]|nr:acyl-CoA synthetase [Chloroflexota bacterium]|tara:strand:+ start:11095 stop:12759 length:1665 start_codon:yes stop_codon:yes gene_type:complete
MYQKYLIGDYENTYKNFQLEAPKRFNWAYEVFDEWAKDPSKLAMLWVNREGKSRNITFKEMSLRSKKAANMFIGLGAKPQDHIFVMLPRLVEWWEIIIASIRAQLVSIPGTVLLTTKDIEYRINMSGAKIIITDKENYDKFESIKHKCASLEHIIVVDENLEKGILNYEDLIKNSSHILPNPQNLSSDLLMGYFTSGTTGYPKMVLNTHASYPLGHIVTGKYWLDNRPTDLHWTLSDTGWAQAAWTCFFAPWNMGAAIFIWDQRGKFDSEAHLKMLEEYPISTFFAPPTAYRMLVQEKLPDFKFKNLRHCVGAGEAVNPDLNSTWKENTGFHIWEGYGQTETTLCIATFPGVKYKPGSMGVVAPGFEINIVDDNGKILKQGEEGEIAIKIKPNRPLGLFKGYWDNPEANENSFRNEWYFTGDKASQDNEGYFWFVGRGDDVINSSSYRIGPFEVESALGEHTSVAETAVIGSPDPVRGEIVKAFVVLSPGIHPFELTKEESDSLKKELQLHVKTVTAPYKYPREIEFVTELPKTISGKIRRNLLREKEIKKKSF